MNLPDSAFYRSIIFRLLYIFCFSKFEIYAKLHLESCEIESKDYSLKKEQVLERAITQKYWLGFLAMTIK